MIGRSEKNPNPWKFEFVVGRFTSVFAVKIHLKPDNSTINIFISEFIHKLLTILCIY